MLSGPARYVLRRGLFGIHRNQISAQSVIGVLISSEDSIIAGIVEKLYVGITRKVDFYWMISRIMNLFAFVMHAQSNLVLND